VPFDTKFSTLYVMVMAPDTGGDKHGERLKENPRTKTATRHFIVTWKA